MPVTQEIIDMAGQWSKELERWRRETYNPAREKFKERKERFLTPSGIEVDPVYASRDSKGAGELPGEFPYTRGIQPTLYRARLWTMRQYSGYASAEETNRRFRYLLDQGQTGLSVAFDLPTQMGLDSDAPLAAGEVGKVGVAIDSIHDMRILLADLPLDKVSVSMTINATAAILLALYVAVAEERGIPAKELSGTIQNDILKEYIARGTYIFPPRPSIRLIVDTFAFGNEHVPRWNTISISGYHIREAGATAVQELAFTFGDAIAYLEAAREAGLPLDRITKRVSFFFGVMNDLFEEVGKFRAARRIWSKILTDRFGLEAGATRLKFHTQTGGSTLTAQQPQVNISRVTIQALAAVLGGTQSLHTNSYDEALSLPTEESARIALRTQQVIASESGLGNVVDPLGGSYYVESLTDRIEEETMALLDRIEEEGGMLAAIESGFVQREIQQSAYDYQKGIEAGEIEVVGVNRYRTEETAPPAGLVVGGDTEETQKARLKALRAGRDSGRYEAAMTELEKAASGVENIVPYIKEAVLAEATVGEICDRLRTLFGKHEEIVTLL